MFKGLFNKKKSFPENDFNYVLDPVDVASGYVLACQSTAKTDIKVSVELLNQGKQL